MQRVLRLACVFIGSATLACGGNSGGGGGTGGHCGPENCDTCCTAGGLCAPEATSYVCGAKGKQCVDCLGAACEVGGTCGPAPKRFFVTSASYTGNLVTAGGEATGLKSGDALCAVAAESVLPGSTWHAWLSDSTTNAIDRITDVGPWYLFDGTEAFADKASLTDFPTYSVEVDENADRGGGGRWTGTDLFGRAQDTCTNWTTEDGFGEAADSWGSTTPRNCFQMRHLYCIEQ
jgi:hypothetical protein